jgi:hypothetical protein
MASRSSWSRFPPITLSVVTRDRRHRQDDDSYAAETGGHTQCWRCITYGLAACRLGRGGVSQRCGELLITARRAADLRASGWPGPGQRCVQIRSFCGTARRSPAHLWCKRYPPDLRRSSSTRNHGRLCRLLGIPRALRGIWSAMSQGDDPRIVLRDPVGIADQVVEHPSQPGQYVDQQGNWEQTDPSANWRHVGDANLRVYDLVEPTTG